MTDRIPYRKTWIDDAQKASVLAVLDVGLPSYGGDETEHFEVELAATCGVRYGVATNSGTSALLLILMAAGIGRGDEVILGANDYIGCLSAIAAVGATPVFVDVEADTANVQPGLVAAAIGPRTRAILATHLYGHPCAVDELATIAAAHGLIVIEDFAHALGAKLHGKPMGSIGRVGFCSFSGKHITVFGPGGAAVTDDPALAEAMSSLRDQGRNRDHRISFIRRSDESWYDQERIGLNLHLSEVSAALGRHQLRQLPQWHAHRRAAASTYGSLFSDWGLPLELPPERAGVEHAYLHYTIKTPARDQLKAYLHERGIETQVHYPKALHHLEPVRRTWPDEGRNYPIADRVAARVLSLPVGPHLNRADIERIADGVRSYFQSA